MITDYLRMNDSTTSVTSLAMVTLPTAQTVRHTLHRYVLVARQRHVADPAAEVLDMPEPVLCRSVLGAEDQFIAGGTTRDVHLAGKVSTTEELTIAVVIQQVLQHLSTLGT